MMGGMASPAVDFRLPAGVRVPQGWHCGAHVVPCTLHVLWQCPAFHDLRQLPRPTSLLASRVGWHARASLAEVVALSRQLGQLGSREVARRGRLQRWIRSEDAPT